MCMSEVEGSLKDPRRFHPYPQNIVIRRYKMGRKESIQIFQQMTNASRIHEVKETRKYLPSAPPGRCRESPMLFSISLTNMSLKKSNTSSFVSADKDSIVCSFSTTGRKFEGGHWSCSEK
eukprot:TRINITY_DN5588_c0_g1_i8.p1 TRINITY_DN5588_c0_g1~~TRINITY_DN5588_c0_g1_i8.p1  ORF type:complete len:120 (-),score=12.48 TRINITY_DN5588_c0_g1_i8:172-531(-)